MPAHSRTVAASALLDAILALGASHLSYLRRNTDLDDREWSKTLRSSVDANIAVLTTSNGGNLTAGPAGIGSEVELVLASIGILMYSDVGCIESIRKCLLIIPQ